MTATLPASLAALLEPAAYPHPVTSIELVETHVSWVLLTGDFAYKIKRPVHYPFIDLRSLERRAFCCQEEVRLNQRFAPDLYLEVCPITHAADSRARIGGEGEVIEHAVRMHQFQWEEELDQLLAVTRVEPFELERFGHELADIHERLPSAMVTQGFASPTAIRELMLENLAQCVEACAIFKDDSDDERFTELRAALEARLDAAHEVMAQRLANGRVRECHGDLHARNIVRRNGRLIAFDCMEFAPELRWIDVADEIAFLVMDLHASGYPLHANAFLNGYLTQGGDYAACLVTALYQAHRALVRAKILALRAAEVEDASTLVTPCRQYLSHAERALSARRPQLVLMHGYSGSGKTWIARRLAAALDAVHLRSDIERKRLAGLTGAARTASAPGEGLYSLSANTAVYEHLARCAQNTLTGGYTVIVDAAFGRREERAQFRKIASERQVPLHVVHCQAPLEVLGSRITERQVQATDPSEADLAVLRWQQERFEALTPDETLSCTTIDTSAPGLDSRLDELVRMLSDH